MNWIIITSIITFLVIIFIGGFLFVGYVYILKPLLLLNKIRKRASYIYSSMENIDKLISIDQANKNEDLRKQRESLMIKANLEPYEVLHYQKQKLKEELKDGNTKGIIKEENRREEVATTSSENKTKDTRRGFWSRIFRRRARDIPNEQPRWTVDRGAEASNRDYSASNEQWLQSVPNNNTFEQDSDEFRNTVEQDSDEFRTDRPKPKKSRKVIPRKPIAKYF